MVSKFKKSTLLPTCFVYLVSAAAVMSLGCSRIFSGGNGSGAKQSSTIQVKTTQFACLKNMPQTLNAYISDQADSAQTQGVFDCVDTALTAFTNLTQGASPSEYSAPELVQFFNRYMLQDNQITDAFMTQIMKLKVLAIGGSALSFTRQEITSAHALLKVMAGEAQNLRGHWKMLLFTQNSNGFKEADLIQAHQLVKSSLNHLITSSNAPNSNYSWADFQGLVDELESFLQAKNSFAVIKTWMPMINAVHGLFMGDSVNTKTMQGWVQLGNWTTDAYTLIAKYHYQIVDTDFSSLVAWQQIIRFADGAFDLLASAPQMVSKGMLNSTDIDKVVDQLFSLKIITGDLTPDIIKETYRHVFVIFKRGQLSDTVLASMNTAEGFDKDIFNHLKFEYMAWKLAEQQFIKVLQANNNTISYHVMYGQLQSQSVDDDIQAMSVSAAQVPELQKTWQDWLKIMSLDNPLIYENGAHLLIPAPDSSPSNIISLTLVNALRSLVRFTEMGYGKAADVGNTDLWSGVFSEEAIRQWESDFEKFGRAVHFLDPRQADSGGLAYMNARYFTFASTGATLESSQQLLELLALMVSGGKVVADQMMVDLDQDHCLMAQRDPSFNQPVAEQLCFEKNFKKNFAQLFASLSTLQNDVNSGHIHLDDVIQELEVISRDTSKAPGVIEYSEMRVMAAVLYYMESLMVVFDKNHDQELDMNEVLTAYPRFRAMVQQMSPIGDNLDEDAYLYIVYKGQKPVVDGVGSALSAAWDFGGFVIQRNRDDLGKVTRLNLLKVIAVLKQQADAAAAGKTASATAAPIPSSTSSAPSSTGTTPNSKDDGTSGTGK